MIQFAGDVFLQTAETQVNSPVVFEGLLNYGLYNVIVFPLTENGIVGTSVAFTQEIIVTPPSIATTTTPNISSSKLIPLYYVLHVLNSITLLS